MLYSRKLTQHCKPAMMKKNYIKKGGFGSQDVKLYPKDKPIAVAKYRLFSDFRLIFYHFAIIIKY